MPVWLTIILALGGSSWIGLIVKEIYDFFKRTKNESSSYKGLKKEESIRDIIRDELQPIKAELAKQSERDEILSLGLQSLLRDKLHSIAEQGHAKGYATVTEKQNFENLYTQYHKLGANGVMDIRRIRYLELPDSPEDVNGIKNN